MDVDFRKGGVMTNTFFDTHDYVSQLMASGIPIQEAEAHAMALGEAMNNALAKKTDLNEFRAEVKGQMAEVKGQFREFRAEVKGQFDLLKWMIGFSLTGTVALLLKVFH
jgi:hypothetical protein